ncbi:MAG: site-specific integrase [Polyangiaceae bacterium]|nr:site-specific integrase [Polyangiaceae bacterium]
MSGPPRTGSVESCKRANGTTYFRGRIRLGDGSRKWIDVPDKYSTPAGGKTARERAELYVTARQEREDEAGELLAEKRAHMAKKEAPIDTSTGESADTWYDRYHAYAKELGQTDADKKRDRWRKWISQTKVRGGMTTFGALPMLAVTRDDVEDVRDELDRAIEAWKRLGRSEGKKGRAISGKTAINVWSCLTSSFKTAVSSKRRELRVLEGRLNPCVGVEPPGDRESRQVRRKTFLYPKEAAKLLSCSIIEREWREIYALALYTYLRPGELRVLTVGDVDLDARNIHVTKAWDYAEERIKPPKTRNGVRRVPIEPSLAPLLEHICKKKNPTDLVVPVLSAFGEDHLAELWRKHLLVAEVERAELHISTRTHVQSNFRSCRDSGITWLALAGVDVTKMMRRAGHDHVQTTMGYVKLAEDLQGDLGAPFGPLPTQLVKPNERIGPTIGPSALPTPKSPMIPVPEEGVEPPT